MASRHLQKSDDRSAANAAAVVVILMDGATLSIVFQTKKRIERTVIGAIGPLLLVQFCFSKYRYTQHIGFTSLHIPVLVYLVLACLTSVCRIY